MRDIGTLGGNFSIARDISDLGGATGYATTKSGDTHAFAYCAGFGQMSDLGTLGGRNSYGQGINRLGHAVGYSETSSGNSRAFLHDGGAMKDIGTLGGRNSYANAINGFDFVVGSSQTATGESHAFVYHEKAFWFYGTTMMDLNDLLPEGTGWDCLNDAYDINEWGQVIGVGTKNGESHAFLMTLMPLSDVAPVPVPAAHLLLGSCLALYSIRKRSR
jgi:probable HAF family extracellular repeat protein